MFETLLVALLAVPAVAAAVLPFCRPRLAKPVALFSAFLTLATAVGLVFDRPDFGPATKATLIPWHTVNVPWVSALDLRFHIGVDGISWPLLVLTNFLVICCVVYLIFDRPTKLADNETRPPATPRLPQLLSLIFLLQVAMLGVFVAHDVILFFVFFELTLAPMYAIIAGWGGERRREAARKFLLYTGLGSLLLIVGLLLLVRHAGTADLVELSVRSGFGLSHGIQLLIFVFLLVAFAIKSPLWPLHTWLPDAHTQAPTVGSVLLAGVLLKLGTYGLIRLTLPVLPDASKTMAPVLGGFAVAAIVMGSLVCLAQTELKRLIAYSSVGHMGVVLLGVAVAAAGSEIGLQAALLGNLAHGLITGLLFFLVGSVKDRYGTGDLAALGSLTERTPRLAALLCFGAVASFGLPGLAGFWGELFSVFAAWEQGHWWWRLYAVLAAVGAALVVAYFLRMLRSLRPGAGSPDFSEIGPGNTLRWGEMLAFAPLVAAILALGVWPGGVVELASQTVRNIAESVG